MNMLNKYPSTVDEIFSTHRLKANIQKGDLGNPFPRGAKHNRLHCSLDSLQMGLNS